MRQALSLYIHIPFCVKKCAYCDFVSYNISSFENNRGIENYIDALINEINLYKDLLSSSTIMTIYIGGGTPSAIDGKYIHKIIKHLKSVTEFDSDVEITLEVNPGTLDETKINHYLASGVNRISVGLQSTDDSLLKSIGRIHSYNEFLVSYKALCDAGFKNISCDLMFGLPGQTLHDVEQALKSVGEFKPTHVSAYGLKLEEGTPMYEAEKKGLIVLPDEDLEREMYALIKNQLHVLGIEQYEISNYSIIGKESKHNLVYWENKPYLGLGLAAHSKVNQIRFSNTSSMESYLNHYHNNSRPIEEEQTIDVNEDLFETIMLGLRLNKGIQIKKIEKQYQIDFNREYGDKVDHLIEVELLTSINDTIALTDKGRDLANVVFLEFMK